MKYVIMCGGNYKDQFETPKPLLKVDGEVLVERTIRLLKENGIKDIAVSTDIDDYNYLGVEILENKTNYIHDKYGKIKSSDSCWLTAYYPLEDSACYLAGDVYWTEEAIKTIINTKVKDTMFIVAPDKQDGRKHISIKGREPLGYKVQNQKVFRQAINDIKREIDEGKFTYDPISWNLYRKLNGIPMDYHGFGNDIFNSNGDYLVIDDITTDIDLAKNIPALEVLIRYEKGGVKMIKVEVIENFTLGKFNELINIERVSRNEPGKLYRGDKFTCTKDMADYLMGGNTTGRSFVKIIEIIPEKVKEEPKEEIKPDVQIKVEPQKVSKAKKKKNK